ncbi:tRNA(ile)-lysidine synthase [Bacillus sp. OxB-1]|uniref:tRNA lysidine(34) synthetase TilS n=1 Tax=Bacillus sp. (strain OxB-1) TaxID=98228 RepID=UPI000581C57A|nr:tRNA lysidine(34) synthetase TilS [Bacillus sp. OxB-1]BAQ09512.1 tRNA(ile)-lysidine synthase [Bacillus sp. OxB-1]
MGGFERTVLRFIEKNGLVKRGDRLLIACSGGIDSVAVLHFMASRRKRWGIDVAAVHVDHMLRGEESAEDGVLVNRLCKRYSIPFYGRSVPVPDILAEKGGNVQAVCRIGRYALFEEIMQKDDFASLVTAHHADDQLETMLMQMTKGNPPLGMPAEREMVIGRLIRPFFPVTKAEIKAYVAENGLPYREDPSNESDDYMRNRIRHQLLPFILEENASAAVNAVRISNRLQEDNELLWQLAEERVGQFVQFDENALPFIEDNAFFSMPAALQRRAIPLLLNYLYDGRRLSVEYRDALTEQLLRHVSSQQGNVTVDLPEGFRFVREYGKLFFIQRRIADEPTTQKRLEKGVWTPWTNGLELLWDDAHKVEEDMLEDGTEIMYFTLPDAAFPLFARTREDGDRILLEGMPNPKRLSRLFIDEKIARTERDRLPVIVTAQGDVCAVPGVRYGTAFSKRRTGQPYIFAMKRRTALAEDKLLEN